MAAAAAFRSKPSNYKDKATIVLSQLRYSAFDYTNAASQHQTLTILLLQTPFNFNITIPPHPFNLHLHKTSCKAQIRNTFFDYKPLTKGRRLSCSTVEEPDGNPICISCTAAQIHAQPSVVFRCRCSELSHRAFVRIHTQPSFASLQLQQPTTNAL
ncbi:unnamed protein product [Vicia faba]|uniref:Uncharacterized protein n=1 Tax=Vicia faba TaxID=3906 RepID=A0AAV0ZB30_VICFA|nr:unnamed protein product [Vicia faba]